MTTSAKARSSSPLAARTFNARSTAKRFQQVRSLPGRRLLQLGVPLLKQEPQLAAQRSELLDLSIQLVEALSDKLTDASARRAAFVADAEDAFQLGKRKSDDEGSLDQQHPLHGRGWLLPIPSRRSRDRREQSVPFIVPKGIRADSRRTGDLARPHRSLTHRGRTVAGSAVLCSAIWNFKNACTASSASRSEVTMLTRPPLAVSMY